MPVAALAAPLISSAVVDAGLATAGSALATGAGLAGGAALGAGAGAGLGALTGQGAGTGALTGGIASLGGEAGGAVGDLVGFPGIGQAVGGALGGALGSTLGGGNPLIGGVEGLALGGPATMFGLGGTGPSGAGGFGGGIGTAVPSEATSGAVQPLGTPVPGGGSPLTAGSQLASDLNAAPATGGNVGTIDPVTDVSGSMTTGPPVGSIVNMGQATLDPATTGTGDFRTTTPLTNLQTAMAPGDPQTNPSLYSGPGSGGTGGFGDISKYIAPALAGASMLIPPSSLWKPGAQAELAPLQNTITGAQGMQTMLTAPSTTGVLPPGQQQALDYERRAGTAAIEGQTARTGMDASTMRVDELQNLNARIAGQQVGIENQMLTQAEKYAGLAATASGELARARLAQDASFTNSMIRLGAALGGMKTGTNNTGTNQPNASATTGLENAPATGTPVPSASNMSGNQGYNLNPPYTYDPGAGYGYT